MPSLPQSLTTLRTMLRAGEIQTKDILEDLSERIDAVDHDIGAYVHVDLDKALAAAEKADRSLPLAGLPIAIKDNINVEGHPCSCASKFLQQRYTAPYTAGAIERLLAAGGVPFGRTNMDEFAMGSATENSALQLTRNPWDRDSVPGGSSGGSAAAVANGTALAALGSDTGGSIRQPAAFCGVVGVNPTYGRVSRYGLVAFASSFDQIGPMAANVDDAALLFESLIGHDPRDSTSARREHEETFSGESDADVKGMRIGFMKEALEHEAVDSEVRRCVEEAALKMESLGAELVEISLPHFSYGLAAYYILAPAEASANLARFDGVRYGRRAENPGDLLELYTRSREEGFGPEVKRRILLGTYVLSSGFYDSYYIQAQKVRTLVRRDYALAFEKVDVILSPATPTPAFRIGAHQDDPLAMYMADVFTIPVNLASLPGISQPGGFADKGDGRRLPVGLQWVGKHFDEATLFRVARAYEAVSDWHLQKPNS